MGTEIDDESLVAFLDGELAGPEADAIQTAADQDAQVRKRLQQLRASWDLLGDLPSVEPNPDTARTTIEMVTIAIAKESRTWTEWLVQFRWIAIASVIALSLVAGYGSGRMRSARQTEQAMRHLHVYANSSALKYIPNTEFLSTLSTIDTLMDPQWDSSSQLDVRPILQLSSAKRQSWVETLPLAEQQHLAELRQAFANMREDRRKNMAAVGNYIVEQGSLRSEELIHAVRAYGSLIEKIGDTRAAELASITDSETLRARINEEIAFCYELTAEDRAAINGWVYDVSGTILLEYLTNDRYFMPDATLVTFHLDSITDLESPDAPMVADLERLVTQELKGRARQLASALDREGRRTLIMWWIGLASSPVTEGDYQLLRETFDKKPRPVRDNLLILPPAKVRNELSTRPANASRTN
ncbi:MAG: hypothetical protein KDB22_17810 [Planctomycetales bacterium]|nr:hypothetical protein [Planctomycetales bacterium]